MDKRLKSWCEAHQVLLDHLKDAPRKLMYDDVPRNIIVLNSGIQ